MKALGRRKTRLGGTWESKALVAFVALLGIAGRPADSSIQAFHRAFGPKTEVLVSAPTLEWEVWPSEGARVTSAKMLINGEEVDATYNQAQRRLEYTPSKPLLAGLYRVHCEVLVEGRLEVNKDWTFQVSTNATPMLSAPNAEQTEALADANNLRTALGLPGMVQEPRLNAAALAHAKYLTRNHRTGHYEKEGEPGFTGVTPADRLEAFGYTGGSWECVTFNSGDISASVRDLFNAPYHRIPFLQPGRVPAGTGFAGRNFSIKFGESGESGVSYSPSPNQSGVPTTWDGNESPNPLRLHPESGMNVGYPIVYAYFGENNPKIQMIDASVTCKGVEIPLMVNEPDNDDHLENAILLIPKRPLQPQTTYEVHVRAKVNGQGNLNSSWTFTTGSK